MPDHTAPVEDMAYLLEEVFKAGELFGALPAFAEVNAGLARTILDEAGRFCAEVPRPLNQSADDEGCLLEAGVIHAPEAFPDPYRRFVEAGWPGLSAPADFGGQGLPRAIQILVDEKLSGANLSFGLFPGLSRGGAEAVTLAMGDGASERDFRKLLVAVLRHAHIAAKHGAGSTGRSWFRAAYDVRL